MRRSQRQPMHAESRLLDEFRKRKPPHCAKLMERVKVNLTCVFNHCHFWQGVPGLVLYGKQDGKGISQDEKDCHVIYHTHTCEMSVR